MLVRADIVDGKYAEPTHAAQRHVLRTPALDAAQGAKPTQQLAVVGLIELRFG